ncbi:MAG TPA: hypothetical protein PKH29_08525 [Oscillospiraceae bacterium]|nr:hypothetical protein [Oscillospiraceae bacterium]
MDNTMKLNRYERFLRTVQPARRDVGIPLCKKTYLLYFLYIAEAVKKPTISENKVIPENPSQTIPHRTL